MHRIKIQTAYTVISTILLPQAVFL